jgi:hypothetical protein
MLHPFKRGHKPSLRRSRWSASRKPWGGILNRRYKLPFRKRRMEVLEGVLAQLKGEQQQQQHDDSESPPAKKLKTGEHGEEHSEE